MSTIDLTPFSTKGNAETHIKDKKIKAEIVEAKKHKGKFYAVYKKESGMRLIGENGRSLFFANNNKSHIGLI